MRYWSLPHKIAAGAGALILFVLFISALGAPDADDNSPDSAIDETNVTIVEPEAPAPTMSTESSTTLGAIDMEVARQALYVAQIREVAEDYKAVIDEFAPLIDNPAIGDTSWTISMAVQLLAMSEFKDRVSQIEPPSRFQEDHALLVAGFSDIHLFSENLGAALDAGDATALGLLADIYVRGNETAVTGFSSILSKAQ